MARSSQTESSRNNPTKSDPPTPKLHEKHATGLIRPSAGRVQYPLKKVLPENKTSKIVQTQNAPKAPYSKSSKSNFKIFRASKTSPNKTLATFKKRRILSWLRRFVIFDLHRIGGGLSSFQGWQGQFRL